MQRYGVAMVEVPELRRIETDQALILAVHQHRKFARLDLPDGAGDAVGDAEPFVQRGRMDAVAGGKLTASSAGKAELRMFVTSAVLSATSTQDSS